MVRNRRKRPLSLKEKYPPSEPCDCAVCTSYCMRPGWWSVAEAAAALAAGCGGRMMLEFSPDRSFAALSPAFKGCEGNFALEWAAKQGCTFLKEGRCELHGTGFQPLECRFCHHARQGLGPQCHADLERDWNTPEGQALAARWIRESRLAARYRMQAIELARRLGAIESS